LRDQKKVFTSIYQSYQHQMNKNNQKNY